MLLACEIDETDRRHAQLSTSTNRNLILQFTLIISFSLSIKLKDSYGVTEIRTRTCFSRQLLPTALHYFSIPIYEFAIKVVMVADVQLAKIKDGTEVSLFLTVYINLKYTSLTLYSHLAVRF